MATTTSMDDSLHEVPSKDETEVMDDDVFDSESFATYAEEEDYDDFEDECKDATSSTTMIIDSNSNSGKIEKTVYEKVKYHDEIGKLVLTKERITFAPYDGGAPTRGSLIAMNLAEHTNKQVWHWNTIQKVESTFNSMSHSFRSTGGPPRLKLVGKADDKKKAIVFFISSHDGLGKIAKDCTKRLEAVHGKVQKTATMKTKLNGQNPQANGHVAYGLSATAKKGTRGTEKTPLLKKNTKDDDDDDEESTTRQRCCCFWYRSS